MTQNNKNASKIARDAIKALKKWSKKGIENLSDKELYNIINGGIYLKSKELYEKAQQNQHRRHN